MKYLVLAAVPRALRHDRNQRPVFAYLAIRRNAAFRFRRQRAFHNFSNIRSSLFRPQLEHSRGYIS